MTWCAYQVILRLRSPIHVGHSKVSNLQRTRGYVTGRVLWGALTMRLTRDAFPGSGEATDSGQYGKVGKQVHRELAFTYFYPALKSENGYRVAWPWENESAFRHRFLSSYQGTALAYPQQSAAEGMLHEVEFISPNTLDTSEPVFLKGYIFEIEGCTLNWQSALNRIQLGGERGYGWGNVGLIEVTRTNSAQLFDEMITFNGNGEKPVLSLASQQRLLAHVVTDNLPVAGEIEPLVGREWRSDNAYRRYVGQHIEFNGLCFAPGSILQQSSDFEVGDFGIWRYRRHVA